MGLLFLEISDWGVLEYQGRKFKATLEIILLTTFTFLMIWEFKKIILILALSVGGHLVIHTPHLMQYLQQKDDKAFFGYSNSMTVLL